MLNMRRLFTRYPSPYSQVNWGYLQKPINIKYLDACEKEIYIHERKGVKGETLTYLLLCEDYGFRTKHGFVNKFWRRLKLSGLDLPYGSPKPRVICYSGPPVLV